MSNGEIHFDYALTSAEESDLLTQIDLLAVELLGKPNEKSARDMLESRLLTGDYSKISRTTIRSAGVIMGYSTHLELFVPEKLVYNAETDITMYYDDDSDDEDNDYILRYEGQSYSLTADSYSASLFKAQGFGTLNVNVFGDAELCLVGTFDAKEGDPNSDDAEVITNMVLPLGVILASDYLRLYDARNILTANK